jgi:hypothetical protein
MTGMPPLRHGPFWICDFGPSSLLRVSGFKFRILAVEAKSHPGRV